MTATQLNIVPSCKCCGDPAFSWVILGCKTNYVMRYQLKEVAVDPDVACQLCYQCISDFAMAARSLPNTVDPRSKLILWLASRVKLAAGLAKLGHPIVRCSARGASDSILKRRAQCNRLADAEVNFGEDGLLCTEDPLCKRHFTQLITDGESQSSFSEYDRRNQQHFYPRFNLPIEAAALELALLLVMQERQQEPLYAVPQAWNKSYRTEEFETKDGLIKIRAEYINLMTLRENYTAENKVANWQQAFLTAKEEIEGMFRNPTQ